MPLKFMTRPTATTIFLLAALLGCRNGSQGRDSGATSAAIPIASYVKLPLGHNGLKEKRFYFPLLQAYSANGDLLYVSHDLQENETFLRGLPESMRLLKPIPAASLLQQVVDSSPELNEKVRGLFTRSQPTVVAIDLEDCHACSIQEHTLDDVNLTERAGQIGLNYLQIKVLK